MSRSRGGLRAPTVLAVVALLAACSDGAPDTMPPSSEPPASSTPTAGVDASDAAPEGTAVPEAWPDPLRPPWNLVGGCTSEAVNALALLQGEPRETPSASTGDVDGDGAPDRVYGFWYDSGFDVALAGAAVLADGRVAPWLPGLPGATPVATVDLDADGTDELLVTGPSNTYGSVEVARLVGCELVHGPDVACCGVYATGASCAPACGVGTECVPQADGTVRLRQMSWDARPPDTNGDGSRDWRDLDGSTGPGDWSWSWTDESYAWQDGALALVDAVTGEGSLDELVELDMHDGLVCGPIERSWFEGDLQRPGAA